MRGWEASLNKRLPLIFWWVFCLGLIGFVVMPLLSPLT
jgi:hypothetical protein